MSNGVARQYAIDNSNGAYFTFIDAGNTLVPNGDKIIINTICNNIFYDVYAWNIYSNVGKEPNLLGYVYRREYIKAHNIHFSDNNDSFGFLCAS